MSDEFLQGLERHVAEAAVEPGRVLLAAAPAVPGGDDVAVHGAQVLEEVGLLLEHGDAQPARERLLPGVHAEVGLEVPAHAELLPAVLAPVLPRRGALPRALPRGSFGRLGGLRGLRGLAVALAVPVAVPVARQRLRGLGAGAPTGALLAVLAVVPALAPVPGAGAQAAAAVGAAVLRRQAVIGRGETV